MAHALDGPRAKLQRAEEAINAFQAEVNQFFRGEPAPFELVREHRDRQYCFVAYEKTDVPLRFAVLAGEIIHHLRSSLDLLVQALIIQNGQIPSRKSQFPICSSTKSFQDACKHGIIRGVSATAEALIRSVQPFTNSTPDDTVLYVVNELDILDKHRQLVIVTTAVQLGERIEIGVNNLIASRPERAGKTPQIVGLGDPAPRRLHKEGVVVFTINLAEPAPEMTASAQIVPQLAFERCGRVDLPPAIHILRGLHVGTRHTVNLFEREFES